jgi:hypothetical protein
VCASQKQVSGGVHLAALWLDGPLVDPALLPELDWSTLMPVLLGLLGIGGLRTLEKVSGTNKRR